MNKFNRFLFGVMVGAGLMAISIFFEGKYTPTSKIKTFDIMCSVPMGADGEWEWCMTPAVLDNGTVLNLEVWADYIDHSLAVRAYGHYVK